MKRKQTRNNLWAQYLQQSNTQNMSHWALFFSSPCLNPWLSSCRPPGKAYDEQMPAFDIWLLWILICLGFEGNVKHRDAKTKREAMSEPVAHFNTKSVYWSVNDYQERKKQKKKQEWTHCNLSWGLALRFPLITDAGSRRECSHIEFAPLLYNVCTI